MPAIEELPFVAEKREEFQHVLRLNEAYPAGFEPAQYFFRPRSHWSHDPESQDPINPDSISNVVLLPDPDLESFLSVSFFLFPDICFFQ
jgi:hypothetical protein